MSAAAVGDERRTTQPASPFDRVVAARANGFGLAVVAGPARGPEWFDAHALVHDAALRDERLALAHAESGSDLPAIGPAWLVESHAWAVGSLVVAALLADSSLPPLHLLQVLHGPRGLVDAVAVPPDGWRHADPTEAAVALDAHLGPLIDALRGRRAPRALWREASDRIGQAVLWCGEAFDAREEAWSIGAQILAAPTRLRAPARFELRDGAPFRLRTGCCLGHRTPGAAACSDCLLSAR
jgi:hypothetical protein